MNIEIHNFDINRSSVNPGFRIQIKIEFTNKLELVTSFSGTVKVQNGQIIGNLYEYDEHLESATDLYFYEKDVEHNKVKYEQRQRHIYGYFFTDLTSKAIDYIEEMREKDKDKDANLILNLNIKHLELPAKHNQQSARITTQPFIQQYVKSYQIPYCIKHSDWIKKFAPHLGLGNFLLLDLQIPDKKQVSDFWVDLYNVLTDNLHEMELSIRSGDWPKTMFYSRKFYENIKIGDEKSEHQQFNKELRKLFEEDQHDEESYKNFIDGIYHFFMFTSKFIHDKGKKGQLKPIRPIPTKEDAYFAYALGIGLLNVIGKKISKE